ncbi:occludin/ELL domain-containing protein 1 isoform 2-T2 [Sarcophilus harrisii]
MCFMGPVESSECEYERWGLWVQERWFLGHGSTWGIETQLTGKGDCECVGDKLWVPRRTNVWAEEETGHVDTERYMLYGCRKDEARGQCQQRPRKIVFEDELPVKTPGMIPGLAPQPGRGPSLQPGKGPSPQPGKGPTGSGPTHHPEHTPQPQLVPDYILRYPAISSAVERGRYKAVFQDQHAEYLKLHQEVATATAKFQELEALLATLPRPGPKQEARLAWVRREFERKKRDPVFLEKQARCDYLKRKLRHLKAQIQKYDEKDSQDGSIYF